MTPRPERVANYTWHAALGYDLLALLIVRLLWRWVNPVPALPDALKRWEVIAARAGHAGLYVLLFATTVAGWALSGTVRNPYRFDLFGIPIPQIVDNQDRALHRLLEDWHMVLAYALAALIVVHFIGALRHHLIKKNEVLRRMWFAGGAPAAVRSGAAPSASAKTPAGS